LRSTISKPHPYLAIILLNSVSGSRNKICFYPMLLPIPFLIRLWSITIRINRFLYEEGVSSSVICPLTRPNRFILPAALFLLKKDMNPNKPTSIFIPFRLYDLSNPNNFAGSILMCDYQINLASIQCFRYSRKRFFMCVIGFTQVGKYNMLQFFMFNIRQKSFGIII